MELDRSTVDYVAQDSFKISVHTEIGGSTQETVINELNSTTISIVKYFIISLIYAVFIILNLVDVTTEIPSTVTTIPQTTRTLSTIQTTKAIDKLSMSTSIKGE